MAVAAEDSTKAGPGDYIGVDQFRERANLTTIERLATVNELVPTPFLFGDRLFAQLHSAGGHNMTDHRAWSGPLPRQAQHQLFELLGVQLKLCGQPTAWLDEAALPRMFQTKLARRQSSHAPEA